MSITREVLQKYVTKGYEFIETGTRWGDTTIKAIELGAGIVHTIEIDPMMRGIAKAHICDALRGRAQRVIFQEGDSPEQLSRIISTPNAVVFLDAHSATSPLIDELDVIKSWRSPPKTILIDDVRCFSGWGFSVQDVIQKIQEISSDYKISYEDGFEPKDILAATL